MNYRPMMLAVLAGLICTVATPTPAHAILPFGVQNGSFNCSPTTTVTNCVSTGNAQPTGWSICSSADGARNYHWGKNCGGFFFGSNLDVFQTSFGVFQNISFTPGPALLSFCVGKGATSSGNCCNRLCIDFGPEGDDTTLDVAECFTSANLAGQLAANEPIFSGESDGTFTFNPATCFTHVVIPVVIPACGDVTLAFAGYQAGGFFDPTNVQLSEPNATAASEISPDSAMAPIGLLAGALLTLMDRRRR